MDGRLFENSPVCTTQTPVVLYIFKEVCLVNEKLVPGLTGQTETIVCEHNVAHHVNKLSTPSMILLMEKASSEAIQHLLEAGQVSVGFEVNIKHFAPGPMGARVVAYAEVTEVDRNKMTFKVEAYAGETKIGEGTHRRAIILLNPGS